MSDTYLDPDIWPANTSDLLKHEREERGLEIEATLEREARDHNGVSRWMCAAHAAVSLIPGEHAAARRVADIDDPTAARLAVLTRRIGHLSHAVTEGERDIEGRLLAVAACALAWLDRLETDRAR